MKPLVNWRFPVKIFKLGSNSYIACLNIKLISFCSQAGNKEGGVNEAVENTPNRMIFGQEKRIPPQSPLLPLGWDATSSQGYLQR